MAMVFRIDVFFRHHIFLKDVEAKDIENFAMLLVQEPGLVGCYHDGGKHPQCWLN